MSNEIMEEFMSDVITEQDFIYFGWKKVIPSEHGWHPEDYKPGEYFYDYTDTNEMAVECFSSNNFEAEENGWSFGFMNGAKFYSRNLLYNMMALIAQFKDHAAKNVE